MFDCIPELPAYAAAVLAALETSGNEAWVVGGEQLFEGVAFVHL